MVQKNLPLINSAHGSETRNIINELIKLFNGLGYSYNAALKKAHEVLSEAQKTNDMNKSVQKQIDLLIAESGTSDSEVLQARIDDTGKEYTVLKERLDAEKILFNNRVDDVSITDQTDYVKDLTDLSSASKLSTVEIAVGNLKQFFVNIPVSDKKAITYAFRKNGNDDYITLMEGAVGNINEVTSVIGSKNNSTESGTFTKLYAPNYYTTEIGAWIATDFIGTKISLNAYTSDQGGIWEAILNEGTGEERRKTVSVYSSSSGYKELTLFENLEFRKHSVKLVFKGADPANPVSLPRGWFRYGGTREQDIIYTFNVYNDSFTVNQTTPALYHYSNKEFALNVRPAGSNLEFHYIPEHNLTGTAFNVVDTKLLVDGVEVEWVTGNHYIGVETVQLVQRMLGYHPSNLSNPLMEITTYHTIKNGVCTIQGKINILRTTEVDVGYALMLPYFSEFADKIRTSTGNEYNVVTDNPNYKEYWAEEDNLLSVAIVSNSGSVEESKTAVAMTIDNFNETMRKEKNGRGNPFSWIEHRSADIGKIYFQQFKDTTLPAGFTYSFKGRYVVALVDGISDFIL